MPIWKGASGAAVGYLWGLFLACSKTNISVVKIMKISGQGVRRGKRPGDGDIGGQEEEQVQAVAFQWDDCQCAGVLRHDHSAQEPGGESPSGLYFRRLYPVRCDLHHDGYLLLAHDSGLCQGQQGTGGSFHPRTCAGISSALVTVLPIIGLVAAAMFFGKNEIYMRDDSNMGFYLGGDFGFPEDVRERENCLAKILNILRKVSR